MLADILWRQAEMMGYLTPAHFLSGDHGAKFFERSAGLLSQGEKQIDFFPVNPEERSPAIVACGHNSATI